MKLKLFKAATFGLVLSVCGFTNAGVIDSSSVLLDDAGATLLENWYGQGDLDWNSIWYGSVGATSSSWHDAVDGITNTFSIYNVTYNNNEYLIGGYNSGDWGGPSGYTFGLTSNFIFNLTSNLMHDTTDGSWNAGDYATYKTPSIFATFGGGHDLHGGATSIGNGRSYTSGSGSYNGGSGASVSKGNIINNSKTAIDFSVNALETFTVSSADASVPEPSTLAIFALGIIGLASRRFKKQS